MLGRNMVGRDGDTEDRNNFIILGSNKMAVISGVGTRDYYRKLGYKLDGPYMSKSLLIEE